MVHRIKACKQKQRSEPKLRAGLWLALNSAATTPKTHNGTQPRPCKLYMHPPTERNNLKSRTQPSTNSPGLAETSIVRNLQTPYAPQCRTSVCCNEVVSSAALLRLICPLDTGDQVQLRAPRMCCDKRRPLMFYGRWAAGDSSCAGGTGTARTREQVRSRERSPLHVWAPSMAPGASNHPQTLRTHLTIEIRCGGGSWPHNCCRGASEKSRRHPQPEFGSPSRHNVQCTRTASTIL
jgi:hypothetical protein